MFQPGSAGDRPRTHQPRVAQVRQERGPAFLHAVGLFGPIERDRRQFLPIRNAPGFRSVGEGAIRQHDHRRHEGDGQADRLVHGVEAIRGGARGEDRGGRLAVAAEERLQQVRLLRLRRQAGAGATALHVDQDQGQFGHHPQTERLRTEREAGAARGAGAEAAGEGGAQRGADGRHLVLGLKGADAEALHAGQVVKHLRRRRGRRRGKQQRQAGDLGGGGQPQGQGFAAGHAPIAAGRDRRRADAITHRQQAGRFGVLIARLERPAVGLQHVEIAGELVADPGKSWPQRAVAQPVRQPEREEVAAPVRFARRRPHRRDRRSVERRDRHCRQPIGVQRAVLQRIDREAGLQPFVAVECALIDDQHAARFEVLEVTLRAAGFMATNTSSRSPGVWTAPLPNWI